MPAVLSTQLLPSATHAADTGESNATLSPFVVTPAPLAPEPVSPRLYGHFIELGYGYQVEPMWAELLFNRSFERFAPYNATSITWFDLWNDPRDRRKGYKTDWRSEDWWHSGYEHNPWFAAPGLGALVPIDANSTFVLETSPTSRARIWTEAGGSGHGLQSLHVSNREPAAWAGLAQNGKLLRAGETYRFRGSLRSADGRPLDAELRLYPEGDWSNPITTAMLEGIGFDFTEHRAELRTGTFAGRATFALFLPPGREAQLDDFSLMPANTFHGWRPETLRTLRQLHPGIVRVPGGCFASFCDWREGAGPHRRPTDSYFWGGFNYNDVGVAELAILARAAGAEVMWAVNIFHPEKRRHHHWSPEGVERHGYDFPGFTDLEEGALRAAELVAYANLPADKHPLARLREQHGWRDPFGITYWEMDNEACRWFEPEDYARAVVVYAKAMKAVDPTIKIGLGSYGGRPHWRRAKVNYQDRIPEMLAIAGGHVDFLADRGPADRAYLDRIIGFLRDYNGRHGTHIKYCNTEKLFYDGEPDAANLATPAGNASKSFMFSKWHYALNVLKNFMAYQRAGGEVDFVIFNNLANTHSQSVMETPKEGAYLTAAGRAMQLLAESPAAWPLRIEGYTPTLKQEFQVQAAFDRERQRLILYALNRVKKPAKTSFNLAQLGRTWNTATTTTLIADGPLAMNTLVHPDAIRREETRLKGLSLHDAYLLDVPPYSFVQVVLE